MIGKILIRGHIGPSYVDEKGGLQKGVELIDVIDQVESQKDATSFEVAIISPGGFVDVGNDIYDYLKDIDKTKPVTTIQKGLVGSIATKIFLSGRTRLVDDRYEFWIHNPFKEGVTGDADQLRAEADATEKTEKEMRKFYGTFSTMGDVALDALMKRETGLTAEQCIKYGFATGKVQAPVFNIINKKNMSTKKEDTSLRDGLLAFLGIKPEEKKKGVAPKAAVPANGDKKNIMVELEEGSFWVEADALAEGVPAFLLDADGQPTAEPLPDGDYKGKDGSMITVTAGVVTAVNPGEAAKKDDEPALTEEAIAEKVKDEVAKIAADMEKKNKETLDAAILAMKKDVKLGVAPKKAGLGDQATPAKGLQSKVSITEFMQAKREERKNKLNNVK